MRDRIPVLLTLTLLLLLPAGPLAAETIRVPADVSTIQGAINVAANGDIVEVADGTWAGDGNRDLTFNGKAITVRSANGPENCIIDCDGVYYSDEHWGFILENGEGRDSVVQGFTIIDTASRDHGSAINCVGSSPTITGNILRENYGAGIGIIGPGSPLITGNSLFNNGGGLGAREGSTAEIVGNSIYGNDNSGIGVSSQSTPLIQGNMIEANGRSAGYGGGINIIEASPTIRGNVIRGNICEYGGGGIAIDTGNPLIENNLIEGNVSERGGGGIYCEDVVQALIINNTVVNNQAEDDWESGGGLFTSYSGCDPVVRNCIFWGNEPFEFDFQEFTEPVVTYTCVEGGWTGTGNIDSDPLFCGGPYGAHYLSQTAAGEAVQSPCVDAGAPGDENPDGTTRSDSGPDTGRVDMGYHHDFWTEPWDPPQTIIVSGPSGAIDSPVANVVVSNGGAALTWSHRMDGGAWSGYSGQTMITLRGYEQGQHTFEVRARDAAGHVDPTPAVLGFTYWARQTGGPWYKLVTGPGPGPANPTLVRTQYAEWEAYGVARYGVNVACGNLDGEGGDEVITGPGPGAVFGPHVRGWDIYGTPLPGVSFIAYGTLKYGVNVAAGDVDGDGYDEIITGAGPGAVFGPHVRGWNVDGGAAAPMGGISYFAYGTLKWGVNVCCGDIDGDGTDEIITGAGPGAVFGPHVRGWRYQDGAAQAMPAVSFLAYGTNKFGVNVACGDLDDDGIDEIITGAGPGQIFGAHVRGWNYDGSVTPMPGISFFAFDSRYGASVAASDVDFDGIDEIITATGPDPDYPGLVIAWDADEGDAEKVYDVDFQAYDNWMSHGARVAGIELE